MNPDQTKHARRMAMNHLGLRDMVFDEKVISGTLDTSRGKMIRALCALASQIANDEVSIVRAGFELVESEPGINHFWLEFHRVE